jgi:hypothetical protein
MNSALAGQQEQRDEREVEEIARSTDIVISRRATQVDHHRHNDRDLGFATD